MEQRRIHRPALVSVLIAGLLACVGAVRLASYYRGAPGEWLSDSFLGFLAYQPESYLNVRYFKILASLSFVSFVYFTFRWMNRVHRNVFPPDYPSHHRDLDFRSPWLRLALLTVINAQWVIQECYKFWTKNYPYSSLESWQSNAIVLAVSGTMAFFGMKYLSFAPLLGNVKETLRPRLRPSDCPSLLDARAAEAANEKSVRRDCDDG